MNIYNLLKYLAFGLGIIAAIFALMIMTGSESVIDYIFYIAYAVLFLILGLVLIYVIKGLFAGNIKKTLISLGLFLGMVLVSYLLSSGSDLNLQPFIDKGVNVTEATSRNVGAGLYTFYFLSITAVGVMLFFGVKKLFNK
jgi:hypothetical protein